MRASDPEEQLTIEIQKVGLAGPNKPRVVGVVFVKILPLRFLTQLFD